MLDSPSSLLNDDSDFSMPSNLVKNQETRSTVVQQPVHSPPASELKELLEEVTRAVDGATEKFDMSPLYHHDLV